MDINDSQPCSRRSSLVPLLETRPKQNVGNRHRLGLLLLGCALFLWTLSNFLGSSIFADNTYAKPFFLSYLNSFMYMLAALPTMFTAARKQYRDGMPHKTLDVENSESQSCRDLHDDAVGVNHIKAITSNHSPAPATDDGEINDEELNKPLEFIATGRIALAFCIPWLVATYFSKACLQYTSVASVTLLLSTVSFWTLIFGALTGVERFNLKRLCGVIGSFAGILLVLNFNFSNDENPPADGVLHKQKLDSFPDKTASELALGNTFTLLSAIIFGLYTVLLKKRTVRIHPQPLNVLLFFGLVGICNLLLLLPLFPALHYSGFEKFSLPQDSKTWAALLINSISSAMCDICWLYAMVMTSPLVVSVGISLAIPMSLIGEMVVQRHYEGWLYWLGSAIVVGSFLFIDHEEAQELELTTKR